MKAAAMLVVLLLVSACATKEVAVPPAFYLNSPRMPDNSKMQPKPAGNFAKNPNCTGQNVSPPLAWINAPEKTRSVVLLWDDQAGRAGLASARKRLCRLA